MRTIKTESTPGNKFLVPVSHVHTDGIVDDIGTSFVSIGQFSFKGKVILYSTEPPRVKVNGSNELRRCSWLRRVLREIWVRYHGCTEDISTELTCEGHSCVLADCCSADVGLDHAEYSSLNV